MGTENPAFESQNSESNASVEAIKEYIMSTDSVPVLDRAALEYIRLHENPMTVIDEILKAGYEPNQNLPAEIQRYAKICRICKMAARLKGRIDPNSEDLFNPYAYKPESISALDADDLHKDVDI
jgi:hypothetical protein